MHTLLRHTRTVLRQLRRSPGFTLITAVTLAIGIGANAAIFSVVHAVLIRPLPYPEAERLVGVWHTAPGIGSDQFEQADATYLLYRKHNRVFEDIGGTAGHLYPLRRSISRSWSRPARAETQPVHLGP